MKTFKANTTYKMKFIGDSDLIVPVTIKKRTEKTAWFTVGNSKEVKRSKINTHSESEFIYPCGQYSMAPTAYAKRPL